MTRNSTKDYLPENPEGMDVWFDAVGKFNDRFKLFLKALVYLYDVKDLVTEKDLDSMLESTKQVFLNICAGNNSGRCPHRYGQDDETCGTCPAGEYIKKITEAIQR